MERINFTYQKRKKEVIFITDDRKEDWWTIENGKTIRPREELIKEFYDLTGIRILIYNADNFLQFAKERKLATSIKEQSITEVKEVRKADEISITLNELNDIDYKISDKYISKWNLPSANWANLLKNAELSTKWNSPSANLANLIKNAELATQWNSINSNFDAIRKSFEIASQWNSNPTLDAIRKSEEITSKLTSFDYTHPKTVEASKLSNEVDQSNKSSNGTISKLESKTEKTTNRRKVSKTTKKNPPNSDTNK
nr:PIN-like domain-containing protein [Flavobacterium ginsengisoli]